MLPDRIIYIYHSHVAVVYSIATGVYPLLTANRAERVKQTDAGFPFIFQELLLKEYGM